MTFLNFHLTQRPHFFCGMFLPKMMQNNTLLLTFVLFVESSATPVPDPFHTSKFQTFQKMTHPKVHIVKIFLTLIYPVHDPQSHDLYHVDGAYKLFLLFSTLLQGYNRSLIAFCLKCKQVLNRPTLLDTNPNISPQIVLSPVCPFRDL
jgi:hypothetical protein